MICEIIVIKSKENVYLVKCKSVAGIGPIGPRLERGTPMPPVKDCYATEQEAQIDANKLQSYIDEYESKRRRPKRRRGR